MANNPRIVVHISGGCITSICAEQPIDAVVIDYDNDDDTIPQRHENGEPVGDEVEDCSIWTGEVGVNADYVVARFADAEAAE